VLTYLSARFAYLRARLGGQQLREAGVTAVEYALMVAIIALLMVVGFFFLFTNVSTAFRDTGDCVANPGAAGCPNPPAPP
jgi:pilus assembly protein Flp/PilA